MECRFDTIIVSQRGQKDVRVKECLVQEAINEEDTVIGSKHDAFVLAYTSKNNPLIKFIPKQISEKLPSLKLFSVISCGLTIVRDYHFKDMGQLTVLELPNNRIETVEAGSFNDLTELVKLDLKSNQIETLDNKLFATMARLQAIDLSFNKIKVLKPRTFSIPYGQLYSVLLAENVCIDKNYSYRHSGFRNLETHLEIQCRRQRQYGF